MRKIAIVFLLLLLSACVNTDTARIFHQEGLSRSFSYLTFVEVGQHYEFTTEVGGEHMNVQKIWAFKGQQYQITLTPVENTAVLYVSGNGLNISEQRVENAKQFIVEVLDEDTIIEMTQTAHPDSAIYKILTIRLN